MGYYVNTDSKGNVLQNRNKAQQLILDGATAIPLPSLKWQPNLLCVVQNGMFDAVGYCYSESEFKAFNHEDGRIKTWITHPKAAELSGYQKETVVEPTTKATTRKKEKGNG